MDKITHKNSNTLNHSKFVILKILHTFAYILKLIDMKKILIVLAIVLFVSCEKAEEEIKTAKDVNIQLIVGDTYTIDNVGSIFTSNIDEFVAKLSQNKVTAVHVGQTQAVCQSDYGEFKLGVTVIPETTLYADLKEHLGKSRMDIEKLFGTPIKTNSLGTSTYSPIGDDEEIQVAYSSEKSVLISITFDTKYTSELGRHLSNRYQPLVTRNSDALYADAYDLTDSKYIVYVQWNLSYIMASYMTKAEYDKSQS